MALKKIAITGAMGVGKTTLATQLTGISSGIRLMREVARVMAEQGVDLDKKTTIETELQILKYQEDGEAFTPRPFVTDRCLIDLLAYTIVLFPNHTNVHDKIREALNEADYDIIFYIPPEFPIEDDGIRSTDAKFRDEIDRTIKKILRKKPYHEITGSPKLRLEKALYMIEWYNKKQ